MKKLVKMTSILLAFSLCILSWGGVKRTYSMNKDSNLCLYVISPPNKKFCEYRKTVIHDLAKYYKVIVISNGELDDNCDDVEQIITRPNEGYDFGAWKEYILKNYDYIKQFDNLLLANDSFLRVSPLDKAIEQGLNGTCDLYGLVKVNNANLHLQSYFINFKKRVTNSDSFFSFWYDLPNIKTHGDAVTKGELKITQHFLEKKFTIDSFRCVNAGLIPYQRSKDLIDDNCPFVKTNALKNIPPAPIPASKDKPTSASTVAKKRSAKKVFNEKHRVTKTNKLNLNHK